jgi:5,5'-dehydrodivanillate O-demethylase
MCIRSFRTVERYGVIFALLAPQSTMPFVEMFGRDDLEGTSGVYFTHFSMIRNYNYFQDLENLVDSSHVPFLHGRSAFRMTETDDGDVAPAGSDVATISAKEAEYGLLETSSNPGGIARSILYVMPNAVYFRTCADRRFMDLESAIWVVPIDDVSHMFYSVLSIAPDQAEILGRARVAEAHYLTVGRDTVHRQLDELVRGVLDGSKSIEEVKARPFAVHIEDCIVQASQGVLHKRTNEHLGESDGGMILLRKLWKRELEAQAQGKPLTPFRGPTRLPRGVYAL